MRFTISSTLLSNKLGILSKVISPKNNLAILESFLFQIHDSKLTVTANDNSNMMRFTIDLIESDGDCMFCATSRLMLLAMKEIPEQPVTFEVDVNTNNIQMLTQTGKSSIMGQSADEYPLPSALPDDCSSATVAGNMLAESIQRSLFATANEELHIVMNGLCFDFTEKSLNIVASDGRKMVRNMILTCKTETPAAFIMPKKPAGLLRSVLSIDDENEVSIKFNDKAAEVYFEDGMLSCRLIEGKYPRYNSVIPTDNPNIINIDRRSLCGALRRVLPFASESTQLIKLRMSMGNMELHSENIDFVTSAYEDVVCEYTGMPLSIGFNGNTLFELLNNLSGDEVTIELGDPSRAGVIHPTEQPEQQDVLMIIMPMILNE